MRTTVSKISYSLHQTIYYLILSQRQPSLRFVLLFCFDLTSKWLKCRDSDNVLSIPGQCHRFSASYLHHQAAVSYWTRSDSLPSLYYRQKKDHGRSFLCASHNA